MKIKILQVLAITYFLLIFLILKIFSIYPIIFLIAALLIDNFTKIRNGMKNLIYVIAALSVFPNLLGIFLLYLPFCVFGALLPKRSFLRNYVLAFTISFIPVTIIYFITTYLLTPLNYMTILLIFYSIPIIGIILLRTKAFDYFEVENSECMCIFIVIFFTCITASGILDDKSLFIANGVREFSRIQPAIDGLIDNGLIPIYDPSTAQGEATYLWIPPTYSIHFAFGNYILRYIPRILFFNTNILFILLISTFSLSLLFDSILNKEKSTMGALALTSVTVLIGLNFFFLQFLESTKQFYAYPIGYFFLSLIMDNPKKFNEFVILMYISAIIMTIHSAYGFGVIILGASLFLMTKSYYFTDRSELKEFAKWASSNKLKLFLTILIIILLPLFYFQSAFVFKDFLYHGQQASLLSYNTIKNNAVSFFKGFVSNDINILSLRYPDVKRIDDHKIGAFTTIFGTSSLVILLLSYKLINIKKFRVFVFGFLINLVILSSLTASLTIALGGLFRTNQPFLLILLGASMLSFICLFKNKYLKSAMVVIVFVAFIHTIPYAKQNLANIHQEFFASGQIYKEEIDFIKKIPLDGRIITYGLFANAIDFGSNRLTGKYFSRDEREELSSYDRNVYTKIHGQHSFGDLSLVINKSGLELSNYLAIGGYRYLFMNVCYPAGNYVALKLYPNFSNAMYQNNCLIVLLINKTYYSEKVDLVQNVDEDTYRKKNGYKYIAIGNYYNFKLDGIGYKEAPREPEPLKFERLSATKVIIHGDFNIGDWVVFKERFFLRWKAHMDGNEVPVYASNYDLILIKTIKGNNILLEYSILDIEKIFGIFSLIGFTGLIILLFFLLKSFPSV